MQPLRGNLPVKKEDGLVDFLSKKKATLSPARRMIGLRKKGMINMT